MVEITKINSSQTHTEQSLSHPTNPRNDLQNHSRVEATFRKQSPVSKDAKVVKFDKDNKEQPEKLSDTIHETGSENKHREEDSRILGKRTDNMRRRNHRSDERRSSRHRHKDRSSVSFTGHLMQGSEINTIVLFRSRAG